MARSRVKWFYGARCVKLANFTGWAELIRPDGLNAVLDVRRLEAQVGNRRVKSKRQLRVVVSDEQAARIAELAKECSLSVSAYLRNVGLGHEPKSTLDQQGILKLMQLRADLGRLGGLLKLWLSHRSGTGAAAIDVSRLLRRLETMQDQLEDEIKRL